MGSVKDRNSKDLTETEAIKKRWQKYTGELYKKAVNDLDNHNGMVTHLESDILECKVTWALGSITMHKASGGDEIPAELFQVLKDSAVKVLHSICSKFGKLSSGHRPRKDQFAFQYQRRAMPKYVQTIAQLHLFHMLAMSCSKFSK